jgi:hypothetical protein
MNGLEVCSQPVDKPISYAPNSRKTPRFQFASPMTHGQIVRTTTLIADLDLLGPELEKRVFAFRVMNRCARSPRRKGNDSREERRGEEASFGLTRD